MVDGAVVNVEALAEAVRGHGEDIRDLRRTQAADAAEWRAAHDRLRDNIAEEMRIDRQSHSDDMREVRGMMQTGLQQVRDDGQESYRQIDGHLTEQDRKLGRWSPGQTAAVTAVASFVVYVLVSYFGHIFGW